MTDQPQDWPTEKDADDTVLAYQCVGCGKKTTAWRRLRIKGKIGNREYETFKCPYCRGKLEPTVPVVVFPARTCVFCGSLYMPEEKKQRFCSKTCEDEMEAREKR